jgi:hypothetical protein
MDVEPRETNQMTASTGYNDAARPFSDLPAGLVEEVLAEATQVGSHLLSDFARMKRDKQTLRLKLEDTKLLLHESDLPSPQIPTTCATDGSYAIERLLAVDLAAAAAVAVEGLTPPSETRYWEAPHHRTFVRAEVHHDGLGTVLRAVMLGRELELAVSAPHDLVLLDMTLALPVIYFNQAFSKAQEINRDLGVNGVACVAEFQQHALEFINHYRDILRCLRSDKAYAGLPKYATRREVGEAAGWPSHHDDRSLLTLILHPGEYVRPQAMADSDFHLRTPMPRGTATDALGAATKEIVAALKDIRVVYYRPHGFLPALRVEMAAAVADDPHRLAMVLRGLKEQSVVASMLEPYPLYMADRMAKSLAAAIPAFRQVATQRISADYEGDIGEVFFAMHGYRSEGGR